MKRITVDLTKASTETLDLTDKLNPRVGDGQLSVPLHIIYGTDDSGNDDPVDMRDKDIEFSSQDTNKNDIYVSGTVTTNSKGDDPYSGNVTFVFPEGTFKVAGTYDVDKTMFRIINKADKIVLSTVNVKLNVLGGGNSDYNFDPNKTSYNSRLEDMLKLAQSQMKDKIANADKEAQAALTDAKQKAADIIKDANDQAQSLLDDIKQTNDEAKGNVAGDTAATAKQAKQQANDNAGKVHDLQGEVGDARGRFMTLSDRENKQDFNIDRKEDKANANANYAAQDLRNDQQDKEIAKKASQSFITDYLSKMDLHPEVLKNVDELRAKYPNGAAGLKLTADNEHKYLYLDGDWADEGKFVFSDLAPEEKNDLYATSPDNLLINPDFKGKAYGWGIDGSWKADQVHSIDNSMAYSIDHQEKGTAQFYQTGIPVNGRTTMSIGLKVMTFQAQLAEFFALFRDENNAIIDGSHMGVTLPTDTNGQFQTIKMEGITIPKDAVTVSITAAVEGTGKVTICQPQLNFRKYLPAYSVRELSEQMNGGNNLLLNSALKNKAIGWEINGPWENASSESSNDYDTYGIYLKEIPESPATFTQRGIKVNTPVVSASVTVDTNLATKATLVVGFVDSNNNTIGSSSTPLPNASNDYLVTLENVIVPSGTASAFFQIKDEGTGVINFRQPQLNGKNKVDIFMSANNTIFNQNDNALFNPHLTNGALGWKTTAFWEPAPKFAIDSSMAYGCYLRENGTGAFQQENIDVKGRAVLSAAIKVLTTSDDASLQIAFYDTNAQLIANSGESVKIPKESASLQLVKLENCKIPANAATATFKVAINGVGVLNFCQPQLNFDTKIVPYSLKDLAEPSGSSNGNSLPCFKLDTSRANVSDQSIVSPFTFISNTEIKGYAQIAIQGDSSRLYDKKNYKIKTFSDADCKNKLKLRLKPSWPETNKFNLKANFIDATQSRNLASAKLVAAATAVTPIADSTVESHLAKTSNFGQMEGFPVEVYFDDLYNGLYTCNTKKDDKVFGLDADKPGNAAVSVLDDVAQSDTQLLTIPTAKLDNVAYDDELHDNPDPELITNWSKWLQFLNTSTDEDFKANLANYIDVKSAINLYLFGVLSREYDYFSKSVLYLTWNNGKYFYLIPYDLDSNWGQSADGKIEGNPADANWGFSTDNGGQDGKFISNANWNKLFERMYKLFMPEIKEQYTYLRSSVWRTDQLLDAYRSFMNQIPQSAYEKDQKLWPQIPSIKTNTYEQLHQVIVQRSNQMDKWIKTK